MASLPRTIGPTATACTGVGCVKPSTSARSVSQLGRGKSASNWAGSALLPGRCEVLPAFSAQASAGGCRCKMQGLLITGATVSVARHRSIPPAPARQTACHRTAPEPESRPFIAA
eukprot:scaffold15909_cov128-Isochrysis_galbana.AAC.2